MKDAWNKLLDVRSTFTLKNNYDHDKWQQERKEKEAVKKIKV